MARTFHSGRFIPKNPGKYIGDPSKIFYRSSWELSFMRWLDTNNAVLRYASEELAIPYVNPLKLDANGRPKISQYYPDFLVLYRDVNGNLHREIIEIKPHSQSVAKAKMSDRDHQALIVNDAKWKAADIYAKKNGAEFKVLTEKSLYFQGKTPAKKKKAVGTAV